MPPSRTRAAPGSSRDAPPVPPAAGPASSPAADEQPGRDEVRDQKQSACVAPRGGSWCVGEHVSCCDACAASGCASTVTTTTTPGATTTTTLTATSTSTTSTTFPACSELL